MCFVTLQTLMNVQWIHLASMLSVLIILAAIFVDRVIQDLEEIVEITWQLVVRIYTYNVFLAHISIIIFLKI